MTSLVWNVLNMSNRQLNSSTKGGASGCSLCTSGGWAWLRHKRYWLCRGGVENVIILTSYDALLSSANKDRCIMSLNVRQARAMSVFKASNLEEVLLSPNVTLKKLHLIRLSWNLDSNTFVFSTIIFLYTWDELTVFGFCFPAAVNTVWVFWLRECYLGFKPPT